MIRFCSILTVLLLLVTAGCRTSGGYRHVLTANDTGRTLYLEQGDAIRVELRSNPSTGFFWTEDGKPDSDVLRLTVKHFIPAENQKKLAGAPGNQEFIYKAVGSGETGIRLSYKRPWEQKMPEATFQLRIVVKRDESFLDKWDRDQEPLRRVDSKGRVAPPLNGTQTR